MLSGLLVGASVLDFANTSRKTKPSDDTCGVTVSVMPVLIFSVALCAVPAAPPAPVEITVPVLGSRTRRMRKLSIVAGRLLSVTTRGREMIFTLPSFSSAVRRASRVSDPSIEPSRMS